MYYLYNKSLTTEKTQYVKEKETHLFGCNIGLIPDFLQRQLKPQDTEPYKWHISVECSLHKAGEPNKTVIIDIKPSNTEYLAIYELVDIWGISSHSWTPILLKMRGLLVDEPTFKYDKNNFAIQVEKENEAIFSVLYLSGTVENGKIVGKWVPPPASPTNAALLWPETIDYFYECRKQTIS